MSIKTQKKNMQAICDLISQDLSYIDDADVSFAIKSKGVIQHVA